MAFSYQGGSLYALGSGQTSSRKLAALPASAWLTEISVEGQVMLPYVSTSFTSGGFPTYNLVAGLQYGAAGYTPATVTNGTPGTANWLTFASGLPASELNDSVVGTSPTGVMQRASYGLNIKWRGLVFFAAATDVYLELGMDTSQAVATAVEPYYSYFVGYAT